MGGGKRARWHEPAPGAQDLGEVLQRSRPALRRLCASLVDEQSADDLVQETCARATKSIGAFRGESSATTWLLGIGRHVCLDELRRRSRDRARPLDPGPPHAGDASESVAVADLLRRLAAERREAFVLTQLVGLTYEEAASVAECAVGTIRSRVARARAELMMALDEAANASDGA